MRIIPEFVHNKLISIDPDSVPSKVLLTIPIIDAIYYLAVRNCLLNEFYLKAGNGDMGELPSLEEKIVKLYVNGTNYSNSNIVLIALTIICAQPLGLPIAAVYGLTISSFAALSLIRLYDDSIDEARTGGYKRRRHCMLNSLI